MYSWLILDLKCNAGTSKISHLSTSQISTLSSPYIQVYVDITKFHDREINILGYFLQSTPPLEMIELHLIYDLNYDDPRYVKFLEELMYLNRVSKEARILV